MSSYYLTIGFGLPFKLKESKLYKNKEKRIKDITNEFDDPYTYGLSTSKCELLEKFSIVYGDPNETELFIYLDDDDCNHRCELSFKDIHDIIFKMKCKANKCYQYDADTIDFMIEDVKKLDEVKQAYRNILLKYYEQNNEIHEQFNLLSNFLAKMKKLNVVCKEPDIYIFITENKKSKGER